MCPSLDAQLYKELRVRGVSEDEIASALTNEPLLVSLVSLFHAGAIGASPTLITDAPESFFERRNATLSKDLRGRSGLVDKLLGLGFRHLEELQLFHRQDVVTKNRVGPKYGLLLDEVLEARGLEYLAEDASTIYALIAYFHGAMNIPPRLIFFGHPFQWYRLSEAGIRTTQALTRLSRLELSRLRGRVDQRPLFAYADVEDVITRLAAFGLSLRGE